MGEAAKLFISIMAEVSSAIGGLNQMDKALEDTKQDLVDTGKAAEDAKKALDGIGGGGAGSGLAEAGKGAENLAEGLKHVDASANTAMETFKGMVAAEVAVRALEAAWHFVSEAVGEAVDHLALVEKLNAQTAAAIKSTGGAAGVSAQQIQDMANAIEKATGVEGEAVQAGANLLLTFTNIRNVAGAGNDIFNQTTKIMADMSVAMGQDMKSSAIQLGKALNDPEKGMTALQRVGVAFTESQKETVKKLEETGHVLEAQKIILKELNTEFGGSADAFGKTLPGAIEKAKASWENLTDALLGPAIPAFKAGLTELADVTNDVADAISNKGLIGAINDAFGPDAKAIVLGLAAAFTVALWPAVAEAGMAFGAAAAAAAPIIATAAAVAFAARPILQNWNELPGAFSAIFRLVEATVLEWYQTVRTVAGNVYTAFANVANDISSAFSRVFGGIGAFVSAQFNKLPDSVKGPIAGLAGAFTGFVSTAVSTVAQLPGAIGSHVAAVGGALIKPFAGAASAIGSELSGAYQIGSTWLGNLQKYIGTFAQESAGHFAKTAQAAQGLGEGVGKGAKKAADEAAKQAKAIDDTFAKLEADLASIQIDLMLDPAMDSLKVLEQEAGVMKAALKKLMQEGVDPLDADFIALKKSLQETNEAIKDVKEINAMEKKLDDVSKTLDEFQQDMAAAKVEADALGEGYNDAAKHVSILEGAIKKLLKEGLTPNDDVIQAMTEDLAKAKREIESTKEFDKLTSIFGNLDKAMQTIDSQSVLLGQSFDDNAARGKAYQDAINQLIAEGIDPASDAVQELQQKFNETRTATQMWDAATAGALGSVKGLHDGVGAMADVFGVKFDEPVTGAILKMGQFGQGLATVITSVASAPAAFGALSAVFMEQLVPAMVTAGTFIATNMVPALGAMAVATWAALGPWGQIGLAIGAVLVAGGLLIQNWDKIKSALLAAWQAIADGATAAFSAVGNTIGGIFDGIAGVIKGAINAAITAVNFLIRGMDLIHFTAPDWVPGMGGKSWGINIPEIPMLASGGLATKATMAMVGEGVDQEAILPLNQGVYGALAAGIVSALPAPAPAYARAGASVTVNVNYTGSGKWTRDDADQLGGLLVDTLRGLGIGR